MTNERASYKQAVQQIAEVDAALLAVKLLALESLLTLLSGLLLFLSAGIRVLSAIATLCIAFFSFALWIFNLWGKGVEALLACVNSTQQALKTEVTYGQY